MDIPKCSEWSKFTFLSQSWIRLLGLEWHWIWMMWILRSWKQRESFHPRGHTDTLLCMYPESLTIMASTSEITEAPSCCNTSHEQAWTIPNAKWVSLACVNTQKWTRKHSIHRASAQLEIILSSATLFLPQNNRSVVIYSDSITDTVGDLDLSLRLSRSCYETLWWALVRISHLCANELLANSWNSAHQHSRENWGFVALQ